MTGGVRSTIDGQPGVVYDSVDVCLPHGPPRISKYCLPQPAWTIEKRKRELGRAYASHNINPKRDVTK